MRKSKRINKSTNDNYLYIGKQIWIKYNISNKYTSINQLYFYNIRYVTKNIHIYSMYILLLIKKI